MLRAIQKDFDEIKRVSQLVNDLQAIRSKSFNSGRLHHYCFIKWNCKNIFSMLKSYTKLKAVEFPLNDRHFVKFTGDKTKVNSIF